MLVTELGMLILSSFAQLRKVFPAMDVTPSGMVNPVSSEHSLKALPPMLVKELGVSIVTLTRAEHSLNTSDPRLLIVFGILILVSLEQDKNA